MRPVRHSHAPTGWAGPDLRLHRQAGRGGPLWDAGPSGGGSKPAPARPGDERYHHRQHFDALKAAVGGALAEAGRDAKEADELCRNAASVPEWLMTAEQAPEGGEALARLIERIRVEPEAAEVEYRLPLPGGSPLAGTLRQTISLPDSLRT